ncbi:amidohydrolase [Amycolatopsis sp.]|uniref:amidohydrolase n=1 Tax=Amycolatopsis sp. TaxID=37632 RepID=UPI002D7ED5B3|nr:amidohydrolase [Amycolatopsis sp.]HET6711053.1 amidohydrolase [Amycolatopsis sp.]
MNDTGISRRSLLGAAAVTVVAAGVARPSVAEAQVRAADTIVVRGTVLLLDRRFRRAEAVALKNGRVLATGTTREIRRLAGRHTRVVDAAGGTVLPGINDSHLHFNAVGLQAPPFSYPVDTATIAELQDVLRTAVAEAAPGAWVRGGGWNDNRLPKPPDRRDLDAVSTEHPIYLMDFSGHAVAVNSPVLRLAGVTKATPDPPSGRIERDADGEPTGVFREGPAIGLVAKIVPPWTKAEISKGMDAAAAALHSLGITSVTEPGISLDLLDLYVEKYHAGQLPLRFTMMLRGGTARSQLDALLAQYRPLRDVDPRQLRVSQIKLIADGIPTAARTAWLHEPYLDGTNGVPLLDGATIEDQVRTLHDLIKVAARHGFQVGTHSTGDAAIDAVVAGYLAALGPSGRNPLRHYVIHGDLTPRKTLRAMARNDIGVNMNATIKYLLGRTLDSTIGPTRVDYQWPYRTALDAGVRVCSASDAPVTPANWLQGVAGAVLREGQFGGVAGEAERITVEEALISYIRTPAWQDRAESWKGTLQQGKAADITIVDGDLLGADPHDLPGMKISATIIGGDVVYDAGSSAAPATAALSHSQATSCLQQGLCCCRLAEQAHRGVGLTA